MQAKGLLSGAHWFPMHATYFATLTLIYPILENKQVPALKPDVIEGAFEGMSVLEALAKNSLAIERCPRLPVSFYLTPILTLACIFPTDTPKSLFTHLPEKIYSLNEQTGDFDSALDQPNVQRAIAPSQQPSAGQEDADLMRMVLPSEYVTAQADNFDEIFTHFDMDMFYMNNDS